MYIYMYTCIMYNTHDNTKYTSENEEFSLIGPVL